ncbi:MAG: D-glucuronyl C5-epimerase family protein [Candidatus Cloacimonetes bacterium]|jgi:hypothetical protein|nr:D-glucuronyl C5-epimerase family protein [Candidatus Cloacimonadota bacterium]MDD2505768.1 D-glucuronyl C5-epimerase family protein [Candidatus Cloacimonadota bacterium]MDD4146910.1 D-glucuronyl C5-epimerase family protein [Candidatus Cloacimonadota bacterium]MDD4559190.1 D-glucuronyl C5-epimerase family protein [Candidatus Cloacimonadota bacterium]
MPKKYIIIIACVVSLLFVSVVWQVAETKIYSMAEQLAATIFGRPFNQLTVRDEQNIPMQLYNDGEKHYNALFIASEALDENDRRLLGEGSEHFVTLTDKLLDMVSIRDSIPYLYYDFDYPKYNQKAPWASALTQSVGMNALANRAGMDRNLEVLGIAENMLRSLDPDVADLSIALSDSSIWFMEYPAETPYFSLSGMMSTLLHLHKYQELTKNPLAQELFDKGFCALTAKLPEFDYHGYSYYNLDGTKAGRMYHQRHIMLLGKLLEIRQDKVLRYYRDRWQHADSLPIIWQMLLNPRPRRIAAFVLSFLALTALLYLLLAWTQKSGKSDPEHS